MGGGQGASQGVFLGGQSRDIFRGGPVKKNHPVLCIIVEVTMNMAKYESLSDVGESRVWFASKNLTASETKIEGCHKWHQSPYILTTFDNNTLLLSRICHL